MPLDDITDISEKIVYFHIFHILNISIQGTNSISIYNLTHQIKVFTQLFTNKLPKIHTSDDNKLSTKENFRTPTVSTLI